jgi:hypothetical protein
MIKSMVKELLRRNGALRKASSHAGLRAFSDER